MTWTRYSIRIFAALALLSAACSSEDDAKTFEVGFINPSSGALQSFGGGLENAALIAQQDINDGGGVLGGKLELVTRDSKSGDEAGLGTELAEELYGQGLEVIVGNLVSSIALEVGPVAAARGKLFISGGASSPLISQLADDDFVFRTAPSDAFQAVAMAEMLYTDGHRDVGLLYVNNGYGAGFAQAFEAEWAARSGTSITQKESYAQDVGDTYDYRTEHLNDIYDSTPDAIVFIPYGSDAERVLSSWYDNDQAEFAGPWYAGGVLNNGEQAKTIGWGPVDGIKGTSPVYSGTGAEAQKFQQKYSEAFGGECVVYCDHFYDAVMVTALAIEKAGSNDAAAIRDALREVANPPGAEFGVGDFAEAVAAIRAGEDINYVGASGPIDFDSLGDVEGPVDLFEIDVSTPTQCDADPSSCITTFDTLEP